MTQMTPPGWYPDPGQAAGGPPTERWWDGNVWTDQVRAAAGTHAYPTQPAFPAHPGQPPAPRRGLRVAIATGVVLAVLAGIGGGVYALTADDDSGGESGSAAKEPSSGAPREPGDSQAPRSPDGPGGPDTPRTPGQEPGFVSDPVNGIQIPVPDGWTGGRTRAGAGVQTQPIPCPGNPDERCTRGSAYSQSAEELGIDAKTPEAAAKADIKKNAKEGYGGKTYGKITSHKVLASRSITVAGQKGYYVRWKAVTEKSDDGYVESLAFPSPAKKSKIVIVRMGIDDNPRAPSPSYMDQIAKGIKAGPAGEGGGAGQDV
ncbi:DUF2510 domain-containing protein [Streptomyces sp. NPDC015345]|uniref:DUF2510 domain-containing protein n=1 Tax=Streptomyces sp. NPDC015345 TaxID=3364953 RepID=UPI0036FF54F2